MNLKKESTTFIFILFEAKTENYSFYKDEYFIKRQF